MGTKAQGNNKVWLRKALRKCHAAEVGLHNKWVKCTHKSKMALELCRRAGKVALTMEAQPEERGCTSSCHGSRFESCRTEDPTARRTAEEAEGPDSCCEGCSRCKGKAPSCLQACDASEAS